MKIKQLARLAWATALLYVSASCFVLAGILGALLTNEKGIRHMGPQTVLFLGVVFILFALGLLIVYGVRTISIRKIQHEHNPYMGDEA